MKRRNQRRALRQVALLAALCCALLPMMVQAAPDVPATLAAAGPPVLRRALVALVCLLGGFALCLRGWERFDQRRRWRATGLVLCGWGLGIGALLLLRLSEYPQTWNWWL